MIEDALTPLLMRYLGPNPTAEAEVVGAGWLDLHFTNYGASKVWGSHGICVNLRGEMKASAQERTMLETTHCCGTLDYVGPTSAAGYENDIFGLEHIWLPHTQTCLTLKGMIEIFCESRAGVRDASRASRGDAAAATRMVRRRIAATPRPRRG